MQILYLYLVYACMMKKIPNYILKAIRDRADAAATFNDLDIMISYWCDENCGKFNIENTWGFWGNFVDPYESANKTIKDIKKCLKNKR